MNAGCVTLITGAGGFLGRPVAEHLRAAGHTVRGLVRPGSGPLPNGVTPVLAAGLHDREGLARALEGADAVVHLAARVHVMRDRATDPLAEFRRVNVEGTGLLMEAAVRAGVGRFLFVSSVKALGEGGDATYTDSSVPAPADPYGVSKLEAEILVRATADAARLHAPILRLPLVYGPGVGANFLRLMKLVARGAPLPFGAVENRRSLAFSGNVASAVAAALDAREARRETFLFSDGEDVSTPELIRTIARALGRPARLLPVPPAVFTTAGRFGDVFARGVPFPLTSAAVERLIGSLTVDSSRFRRVTGFRPPYSLDAGMARTADWFHARGSGG